MYDYIGHLKKFGFKWGINDGSFAFKYEIKIDSSNAKKLIKFFFLSRYIRNLLQIDESKIWNMLPTWKENRSHLDKSRLSFLIGYLFDEQKVINYFRIRDSFDFKRLSILRKNIFIGNLTNGQFERPLPRGTDNFYSIGNKNFTVLHKESNAIIKRFTGRIQRLFVPRFYHDRKDTNFLKDFRFVGKKNNINEKGFSDTPKFGRKLYEYLTYGVPGTNHQYTINMPISNFDWPFPDKFNKSIGYTIHGFSFKFTYAPSNMHPYVANIKPNKIPNKY